VAGASGRRRPPRPSCLAGFNNVLLPINTVKFHIIIGCLHLLCHPHGALPLRKWICSFYLLYVAGLTDQCVGFHEWPSCLCRVPQQQKGWKTLLYSVAKYAFQKSLAWWLFGFRVFSVWFLQKHPVGFLGCLLGCLNPNSIATVAESQMHVCEGATSSTMTWSIWNTVFSLLPSSHLYWLLCRHRVQCFRLTHLSGHSGCLDQPRIHHLRVWPTVHLQAPLLCSLTRLLTYSQVWSRVLSHFRPPSAANYN